MQNTVGKLLEKIVVRRLAIQLEEDNLLPATLGSYRRGKDTWANATVLGSDVYDAFERKEETLVVALYLEDAYNRVDFKILKRTLVNMKIDPFDRQRYFKEESGTAAGTLDVGHLGNNPWAISGLSSLTRIVQRLPCW